MKDLLFNSSEIDLKFNPNFLEEMQKKALFKKVEKKVRNHEVSRKKERKIEKS